MYGGIGGKLITSEPALPTYDEAASSLPPPPPIEPSRKRPRQDSSTDAKHDDITLLWAEIRAMRESQHQVEAENSTLKQQNTELVTSMETLRQQNRDLVNDMAKLQKQYDALDTRQAALGAKTEAFEDTYDVELADLRDQMSLLDGAVKYLQGEQVGEEAKEVIQSAVVEEIIKRLANG
jgi:small-conductance mechanosensitive channel